MEKKSDAKAGESLTSQSLEQGRYASSHSHDTSHVHKSTEEKIFGEKAREYREEPLSENTDEERETVLVCDLREAFSNYWHDYWVKLGLSPVCIDGANCFYNELPLFRLKGVFSTDWLRFNPKQSCKEIARFYREKGGWFSWYVPEAEDSKELKACLYKAGLEPVEVAKGWHAGSMEYPFVQIDPKFRFVHVDDAKKLGIYMSLHSMDKGYHSKEAGALSDLFKTAGYRSGIMHFIGFYDGVPVGVVSFLRAIDRVCLYHLFVKPEYRKKGIGRLLLQEIVGFAHLFKVEKTVVVAAGAEAFFEKCGFAAMDQYITYSARV